MYNTVAEQDILANSFSQPETIESRIEATSTRISAPQNNFYTSDDLARQTLGTEHISYLFSEYPIETQTKEEPVAWWIGEVSEIRDDVFVGLLEDLSGNRNIVEFDKKEIDESDKNSLRIGSKFTYSVSAVTRRTGTKYETQLAFSTYRRVWLDAYDEKAKKIADDLFPERLLDL